MEPKWMTNLPNVNIGERKVSNMRETEVYGQLAYIRIYRYLI